MRALLAFLALFAVALGLVALATPPAWQLVSLLTTVPFHRVGNRLAMVGLAAGLWLLARWLRLNNRQDMAARCDRGCASWAWGCCWVWRSCCR